MTMQTCQLPCATARAVLSIEVSKSPRKRRRGKAGTRAGPPRGSGSAGDGRRAEIAGGAAGPGGGANGNLASCANRIVGEGI